VTLSRQVDRDHMEPLGEARHRLLPRPPGLRESGEQHDGGAARLAAFHGVELDSVRVDPAVGEAREVAQRQSRDVVLAGGAVRDAGGVSHVPNSNESWTIRFKIG